MNYISILNRNFHDASKSNKFMLDFRMFGVKETHQLNNKDIVEFSKIKVNVEKEKIDKYVPNRYIPKIGDNGKMYKMLDVIAKDELKYIQHLHKQYLENRLFAKSAKTKMIKIDESSCPKLNSIRADIAKQEAIFKDMIFKGIKSDIETIGLYQREPEKTNLKMIRIKTIENKLVNQAMKDIANFTGQDCYLINYQIEEIYNNNSEIASNQKRIDEIGFWKGNFFGTKDEKQQYSILKINNNDLQKSSDEIYNSIKDKIDKTIHISVLTDDDDMPKISRCQTNFADVDFKDNAIMHARTEKELKSEMESKRNDEVPQFLIDRDFSKNADSECVSQEEISHP